MPRLVDCPTPLARLASERGEIFVKRDDLTHARYGGNKVRKLERLLDEARDRGARRIVTMGAAGSHHVLATALFARELGIEVVGLLTPQPRSDHATETLRATALHASELVAMRSPSGVVTALRRLASRETFVIPPGGSTVTGALGYLACAAELADAVREGSLAGPLEIVVPVGSGGTAAGLAVGVARARLDARVIGVSVASPPPLLHAAARALTVRVARAAGIPPADALARLAFDAGFVGRGYGHRLLDGPRMEQQTIGIGMAVDPTYTEKALACAFERAARGAATVIMVATLSSAPMGPLLVGAPEEHALDPSIRALLV
jgi:1-aminocyclopropane-1-carboxylate deaminase/D-cysteine desulfhydrase-like pyridoxal-dependent ACC family enzyme